MGGAAVNNAGAFGGDTASCLLRALVVDAEGRQRWLSPQELQYAYRTSVLKQRALGDIAVLQVELRLRRSTPEESDGLVKQFNAERMRSQPRILSAGSVFANPEGRLRGQADPGGGAEGHAGGRGRDLGAARELHRQPGRRDG